MLEGVRGHARDCAPGVAAVDVFCTVSLYSDIDDVYGY